MRGDVLVLELIKVGLMAYIAMRFWMYVFDCVKELFSWLGDSFLGLFRRKPPEPTYAELLKTEEWRAFRFQVIVANGCRCNRCGHYSKNGKYMHAHHLQYRRDPRTGKFVDPWDYDLDDMELLCAACHWQEHEHD
jgi:hypothetical protein